MVVKIRIVGGDVEKIDGFKTYFQGITASRIC
jgi:hypothetical protein